MRFVFCLLSVFVFACGPNGSIQPGAVYFWQVKTSTLEFGACSDAPEFRADLNPVPISDNTFVIYKISADGKQAVTQKCETLDPKTCADSSTMVVFDVVGREMTYSKSSVSDLGATGCSLQQTETWTLTDAVDHMTLDLVNVLTLINSPTACEKVEADIKRDSPNMLGVEGCVITSKLTGDLK